MGKKSREKRERRQAMANMSKEEKQAFKEQQKAEKERQKEERKIIVKNSILINLKTNWKYNVQRQYEKEPDKVINADIEQNADDICKNLQVKMIMKTQHIKKEDIVRILTEIRDEVIKEAENKDI